MPSSDELRRDAGELGTGCHWRAYGHGLSFRRWRLWASGLDVMVAAASAIAGSTLLASTTTGEGWALIAGIIGLLGAVFAAVNKGLEADERAGAHRRARAAFIGLRTDYFRLARHSSGLEGEKVQEAFAAIVERHKLVEAENEPPEQWADDRATKKWRESLENGPGGEG